MKVKKHLQNLIENWDYSYYKIGKYDLELVFSFWDTYIFGNGEPRISYYEGEKIDMTGLALNDEIDEKWNYITCLISVDGLIKDMTDKFNSLK